MCAKYEKTDFKFTEELKGSLVRFIQEVCFMEVIENNDISEILTIAKIISAQSADADCCSAFASIGKPITSFNIDSDGVLIRLFSLGSASKRDVAT